MNPDRDQGPRYPIGNDQTVLIHSFVPPTDEYPPMPASDDSGSSGDGDE